jgi:phosphoribosylformylglycinamidine synthase
MVGILEREDIGCGIRFPEAGLDVVLIGETREEPMPPRVDLDRERALVDTLLQLHENRLLRACHDISNGGFAVALAECAMGGVGCHVELGGHADGIDALALLFGESQARAIVACKPEQTSDVLTRSSGRKIGRTVAGAFVIERNGVPLIRSSAEEMSRVWRSAFALLLGGDTVDDVIRGVGEEAPEVVAH